MSWSFFKRPDYTSTFGHLDLWEHKWCKTRRKTVILLSFTANVGTVPEQHRFEWKSAKEATKDVFQNGLGVWNNNRTGSAERRLTFILLSALHHDVSVQLLQLSVKMVEATVGGPQLTLHLKTIDRSSLRPGQDNTGMKQFVFFWRNLFHYWLVSSFKLGLNPQIVAFQ